MATEDDDRNFNRSYMPATEIITDACQGLVKIDSGSGIIRLAHFTTYEFCRDELTREFPDTHQGLAKNCLTYLKFQVFDRGPCKYISSRSTHMLTARGDVDPADILARRVSEYPFLKYAADHWGDHAQLSPEAAIQRSISAFLEQPRCLASMIQTRYAESEFAYDSNLEAEYTGSIKLHTAVCYGLEATVDILLPTLTAPQINGVDCRGKTALHWAIESKSTSIAKKLLRAGADLESDVRGERSLREWMIRGTGPNRVVWGWRIGYDLDVRSPDMVAKGDLVYISIVSEQIEVLQTYLSRPNDVRKRRARAKNVLFKASSLGKPSVVELSLRNGGLLDGRDGKGQTPLVVAVQNRHADTVQMLFHHGASLDQGTERILIYNAVSDQRIFEHRLMLVGDMIQPPPCGSTTQELGPGSYNKTIHRKIQALLHDPPILPISRLQTSHSRFLKALHEDSSQKRIIETLLSHGADTTVRTAEGETLLHLAVCSPGRLKILLESPAMGPTRPLKDDIDAKDRNGRTALHHAAAASNPRAMQILLSHEADINARDDNGATPLHYAVEDHECVYMALHAKPFVDARDNYGRNALHYFAMVAGDPDPNNLTDFQKYLMEDNPARSYSEQMAVRNNNIHYSSIPRDCDERTLEILYKAFAEAQDRFSSARDVYRRTFGNYLLATRGLQLDFGETTSWLKLMKERYPLRIAAIEGRITHAIEQATKEKEFWTIDDRSQLLGQGNWSIKGDGSTEEVLSPGQPLENRMPVFEGDKPDVLDSRHILLYST
ncbi:MAG: hypothetical protein Q9174_003310 [Haloplaca sp. 1 TL-2023]